MSHSQATMRGPALRVVHPDDVDQPRDRSEPVRPGSNWTLIDLYAYHLRRRWRRWGPRKADPAGPPGGPRRIKPAAAETVKQDEIALWRWWQGMTGWTEAALHEPDPEKALRYAESQRPEPRLAEITDEVCDDFLEYAYSATYRGKAVSDASVKKWVTHLNPMLARAGPRVGTKKHYVHVVSEAPQIEPPNVELKPPKPPYSVSQIWELIEVAQANAHALPAIEALNWRAEVWWPAVFVFIYNTALRPKTVFLVRWEHVVPEAQLIKEVGRERLENEDLPPLVGRVLDLPPEILKGRNPPRQRIWLNDAAYHAIQPLKRPAGRIFGWPWPTAKSTLHHELKRLLAIPRDSRGERRLPDLSFYGLRRAFATECLQVEDDNRALCLIACKLMMGHRIPELDIVTRHYAGPLRILTEILPKLRQPGPANQKMLF